MGYKSDTVRGISWMTLLRGLTRLFTFVRLAILGRILSPTEFGYFGIATLLLSLLEILTETGINVFLVQEKSHIKEYVSSAWIVSMLRGVILSLAIFLLAPFISNFFKSPLATNVVALTALVPLIRGFINPAIISYQKDLLFNKEFQLRSTLFLVDVVFSIVAGFTLHSAQSFTIGLIASAVVEVLLSYVLIPIWPKLEFEFDKVKHVITKGWWVTLTGIFLYFADNGDNITVGKILGSGSLGIYQVAYKFSTLPISEVTQVVNQVVFPVYVKFSHDKKRLWDAFIKVTIVTTVGSILLGLLIFIFCGPLVILFMGEKWAPAIPAIKILSLYGILRTIFGNIAPVFLSLGKQNYVSHMTFGRLVGLLIIIVPFVMHWGMIGAAYAMLISMAFEIPVIIFLTAKVFREAK